MPIEFLTDDLLQGAERIEPLVHMPRRPLVEPPPKMPFHKIWRQFSLDLEEAKEMGPEAIRDMYVKEVGRQIILELRTIAKRFGRNLTFYRMKLPANTTHRRVFEYDRNGVWLGIIVTRENHIVGKRPDGQPRTQPVLDVKIGTLIALEDGEKLGRVWLTQRPQKARKLPTYDEDNQKMKKRR